MGEQISERDIKHTQKILRTAFECAKAHGGERCDGCKMNTEKVMAWLESKIPVSSPPPEVK